LVGKNLVAEIKDSWALTDKKKSKQRGLGGSIIAIMGGAAKRRDRRKVCKGQRRKKRGTISGRGGAEDLHLGCRLHNGKG